MFSLSFFILAGWELTALAVNNAALPGPFEAVPMVGLYFGDLWPAFLVSLYRVVVAMPIGTVLAIPLGLVCGRSPRVDAVFAPILYFLYPLPKVVLLPVLVVLMGLADAPKIALIALTIFFQVLVTVRDAAQSVPEESVVSMRSLGAGRFDVYRHVIVPATLPNSSRLCVSRVEPRSPSCFSRKASPVPRGLGYFHRRRMGVACVSEDVCRHYCHGVARGDFVRIVRYRRAPFDALAPREELSAWHPRTFDSKEGSV